ADAAAAAGAANRAVGVAGRTGPPVRSVTIALTVAAELTVDPSSDRMASTAESGAPPEPTSVAARTLSSSSRGAGPGRPPPGSWDPDPSGSSRGHFPVSRAYSTAPNPRTSERSSAPADTPGNASTARPSSVRRTRSGESRPSTSPASSVLVAASDSPQTAPTAESGSGSVTSAARLRPGIHSLTTIPPARPRITSRTRARPSEYTA